MTRYFNLFYLSIVLIGAALWYIQSSFQQPVISFFGFAENKETEINFNYAIAVGDIRVQPGAAVQKGDTLLVMYRIRAKEQLSEEPFQIAELQAQEQLWRSRRLGELQDLELKKKRTLIDIDSKIAELEKERDFQRSLSDDWMTDSLRYTPLSDKIAALQTERQLIIDNYETTRTQLEQETRLGKNPYRIERERLTANLAFDERNAKIEIPLLAPHDGLIGNIYAKEGEHIERFRTILSLYEPNPTLVKGYVQEDMILQVQQQDVFKVRSTKSADVIVSGEVVGLGSRIVEIPERLRKLTDFKTYGREVLVRIPAENDFLQKEKVVLELQEGNK
ncbi:MAG: hypothetical protein AAGI23_09135 [Bacteroidota bacterium]